MWEKNRLRGYYPGMKVPGNLLFIREVFEIRLRPEVWQRVRKIAQQNQLSYSWIVRLCLFKCFRKGVKIDQNIISLRRHLRGEIWQLGQSKLHRHMLCLYGDDSNFLRLAASKVGLTITQFVRIALALHLDDVEAELNMNSLDVVFKGTKMFRDNGFQKLFGMEFHITDYAFKPFSRDSYWEYSPIQRE